MNLNPAGWQDQPPLINNYQTKWLLGSLGNFQTGIKILNKLIYLYHCRTNRQTFPICSTPLMKPVVPWCLASFEEQTDSFPPLEKTEWWMTHGVSHKKMLWCWPTSCHRSQKWRRHLEKTGNKLGERGEHRGHESTPRRSNQNILYSCRTFSHVIHIIIVWRWVRVC